MMKVICCSCGVQLKDESTGTEADDYVSHGLCRKCSHHLYAQLGMPLEDYLEGIQAPVVMVGSQGTACITNQKALEIFNGHLEKDRELRVGMVFECENAATPEGCGGTIHCSGCTIRRSIVDTMQTGTSHRNVPACLKRLKGGRPSPVELHISTEKKGDVVFLQVEKLR
jgi:hypothetical protein